MSQNCRFFKAEILLDILLCQCWPAHKVIVANGLQKGTLSRREQAQVHEFDHLSNGCIVDGEVCLFLLVLLYVRRRSLLWQCNRPQPIPVSLACENGVRFILVCDYNLFSVKRGYASYITKLANGQERVRELWEYMRCHV